MLSLGTVPLQLRLLQQRTIITTHVHSVDFTRTRKAISHKLLDAFDFEPTNAIIIMIMRYDQERTIVLKNGWLDASLRFVSFH